MDEQNNPIAGNTAAPQSHIYQESQDKNAKWLWLLIVLIIIGALVFAFFKGLGPFGQLTEESQIASPTPEAIPVGEISEPSPSPELEVDKSEPNIRVLNGTSVAGLAASVKDVLEDLGWTVTSIGNSADYDSSQTTLIFKADFTDWESALTDDLSDDYSVTVSSEELDATDSADIEVIIGTE